MAVEPLEEEEAHATAVTLGPEVKGYHYGGVDLHTETVEKQVGPQARYEYPKRERCVVTEASCLHLKMVNA